jgi:RNA polymerase sigma-70 factor (ECF subfamily)
MPEGAFSVAACLAAVARDDEQAARELVEHLHPLVRRLVRAHLPRSLAEEDLETSSRRSS